jgi:hypothetical protein
MVQLKLWTTPWRIIAAVAVAYASSGGLPTAYGIDGFESINLNFEILEEVDLSVLGTSNLDRYQGTYQVTVDDEDDCQYLLRIDFKHDSANPVPSNSNEFTSSCNPGNAFPASDGLNYHALRRNWLSFPQYLELATGFNHMSLNWKPCGLPPQGLRQPRYDLNFYNVIPHYRKFMTCQEFPNNKMPANCLYNQSDYLGRGHFSMPTLHEKSNREFIANMPVDFQPDTVEPQAYQYEGLVAFDIDEVPNTPENWTLPVFHMSSYDGDILSWRALLPYSFVSGPNSSFFAGNQFYVYQTEQRLPASWNMTYHAASGLISVFLQGTSGICGDTFVDAQQAYVDSIVDGNDRKK